MYAYEVIELHYDEGPEPFGVERFDHHPVVGEIIRLHWLDGTEAGLVKVDKVDVQNLKIYVREIPLDSQVPSTPEERLEKVGKIVEAARDKLNTDVGEQGIAVAVIVRTMDGTSIHVALSNRALAGSHVLPSSFTECLHDVTDAFMAQLPGVRSLEKKDDPS